MTQKKHFKKSVQEQVRIEQQVKGILLMNSTPPMFNHFYMNFGKKIVWLKNKYKGDVLNSEADSLQLHWFRRGLDNLILEQIKCFYIFCEVVVVAYPYNAEDDNDNVLAGENRETIINLIYGYYDAGGIWKRVEVDNAGSLHVNVKTIVDIDINDISKGAQTNDVKITLDGEAVTETNSAAIKTAVETIAGDTTSIDGKITACNTGAVTISAALPAGTNTIGKVGHNISGVGHGNKTVAVAGTDEVLAGATPAKKVTIQAYTKNIGLMAVGATGVDATEATGTGVLLEPGDSVTLEIDNLNDVYVDATVAGEGVRYTYLT